MKLLFLLFPIFAFSQPAIVPQPQEIKLKSGNFEFSSDAALRVQDTSFSDEAAYFKDFLSQNLGIPINSSGRSSIELKKRKGEANSYTLEIGKKNIVLSAADDTGIFYGLNTLIQLIGQSKSIPCMTISDTPKFQWRGMHLDVCRHFFSVSFVKRYIDFLALYKMNTFHWHLTDDQGWRIEIKKHPKLTSIGGWRNGSMVGQYNDHKVDSVRYGGFYTQDQIREVVAYAKSRHITVVPEIEMPGHAVAALSAYPEFSCSGGPFEVEKNWGVFDDVFCPKEETFAFLEDILSEVAELFPSEYLHIGGDECPKTRWKTCPDCQKRIKDEHLADEHELQGYFMGRIEKFLAAKGKKAIGWDEILDGNGTKEMAVMSWRGTAGGAKAAKLGRKAVMTPESHCYFDRYQADRKTEPLAFPWGDPTPIEKVYGLNPVPSQLSAGEARNILGVQANLWTEYIPSEKQAEYMLLPRLLALAEVAWGTSEVKNYPDFKRRVEIQLGLLEKMGANFSRSTLHFSPQKTD